MWKRFALVGALRLSRRLRWTWYGNDVPFRLPLPLHPQGIGLTVDEGGTRRSTRNRVRPLQYWRGESKTYGRDHNSKCCPRHPLQYK